MLYQLLSSEYFDEQSSGFIETVRFLTVALTHVEQNISIPLETCEAELETGLWVTGWPSGVIRAVARVRGQRCDRILAPK